MDSLHFIHVGLTEYVDAKNRQLELRAKRQRGEIGDTLLFVEHPRVITRGRRPSDEDFRVAPDVLIKRGFAIESAHRGGRLTYHGPGQLVVYFIMSLTDRGMKVPEFVASVEESVLLTLKHFGVEGHRRKGCPGVWVGDAKIASIGLSICRGVSMHGVALNVNPDLRDFEVIIPCGIEGCKITSIERQTERVIGFNQATTAFREAARKVYQDGR